MKKIKEPSTAICSVSKPYGNFASILLIKEHRSMRYFCVDFKEYYRF